MMIRVRYTDRDGVKHQEDRSISFSALQNMAEQVAAKGQFSGLNGDRLNSIEILRKPIESDGRPALYGKTSAFLRTR